MNRLIMVWAIASMLIAVTAVTGKAAEITSLASPAAIAVVSESVLWNFGATSADGQNPGGALIADKKGNLYGTTEIGGANSCFGGSFCGTVFELSPPTGEQTQWTESVLWNFGATSVDGNYPIGALIADKHGNLYGMTGGGGTNCLPYGCGTVFELSPPTGKQTQWTERVLWSFGATSDDGAIPVASLLADGHGNLYSTTQYGGPNCLPFPYGCGTAFELSPPTGKQTQWTESLLWSFGATSDDGEDPEAGLIADNQGNLYGTTDEGGTKCAGCGTVFELSPPSGKQIQWSERVLWSFGATSDDGEDPLAGLIVERGHFYGTNAAGGANCSGDEFCGTVFELTLP